MIQPFKVTMTHQGKHWQLNIIAASAVDAVIVGINLMRKMKSPPSISCKPMERKAA